MIAMESKCYLICKQNCHHEQNILPYCLRSIYDKLTNFDDPELTIGTQDLDTIKIMSIIIVVNVGKLDRLP